LTHFLYSAWLNGSMHIFLLSEWQTIWSYTNHPDAKSNTHPAQTIFEEMSSNRKNHHTRWFVLVNIWCINISTIEMINKPCHMICSSKHMMHQ
jgi:hypothetical protein